MTIKQRDLQLYFPVYCILAIIYIFAIIIEPSFFTWRNNVNLFTRITPLVIVGVGQTLVMLSGGIDLSVGPIIGLTNVIAVNLPFVDKGIFLLLWLIIPPLTGFIAGFINGTIIARGRDIPPLIVTLATGTIYQGIALFIMDVPGGELPRVISRTVVGKLFGSVPLPLIIFVVYILICYLILEKTKFGRSTYAVGGNELFARESGINVGRTKRLVYAVSGLVYGFAGIYLSAWMYSGDALIGEPYTLNSIAVAVIGGTSLVGGSGGVIGIIGGAYILQLLANILNLLGVQSFYQFVVKGLVIIAALAFTSFKTILTFWVRPGSKGTGTEHFSTNG